MGRRAAADLRVRRMSRNFRLNLTSGGHEVFDNIIDVLDFIRERMLQAGEL